MLQSKEKLESLGNKVIIFSMQHPRNLETRYSKYFVCNVDYNGSNSFLNKAKMSLNIFYSLEARKKMELLLDEEKPDLAHLHNIYHQISPSILPVLKKRDIPVVMTLHDFKLVCPNYTFLRDGQTCEECEGKHFYKAIKYRCVKNSYWKSLLCSLELYFHRFLKIYQNSVDIFITLSKFSQEKMIQYGIPEKKLLLLPNYIDLPADGSERNLGEYILFFGRLSEKNGVFTLIQAMEKLKGVPLIIAGEGELLPALKEYVREKKLDNITFSGFLNGKKLEQTIENSLFTVFPAICYHNCPMSILESFAYNKPVIGSNLGSIPELINDGIDGLLFEPKNVEDLAEKISYLYRHPLLAQKMGISARKKVEEKYSEEEYYKKLLGIYDNLIKNGGESYV
ncbi:MAG: glycosyltransferase [candidate division Zixibacteria bacterium]|nr:glycosyltransferase [candidate division Zixibacteria bacterium]